MLSGGQKQRVAIARALANGAPLILVKLRAGRDEGRSIVIVTHDHRLRDIADRVLWLEDGQPQEDKITV